MPWRDLLPKDAEVVLASTGNFEFDGEEKQMLGMLVLTHEKLYVILFKGFVGQSPWMHADVPLKNLMNIKVTGSLVRRLEFDYQTGGTVKHFDFVSLDAEVRDIMEKIEYEADNPKA